MNYPKTAVYSGCGYRVVGGTPTFGYPFLDSTGKLRQSVVDAHAFFDVVVAEGQSLISRPDIVTALRAANPSIKIIAFFSLESAYWNNTHSLDYLVNGTGANDVWGKVIDAVNALPTPFGNIQSTPHTPHRFNPDNPGNDISFYDMNLANPAVVSIWVDKMLTYVVGCGLFDGIFFDWAGPQAGADTYGADTQDFARNGYGSLALFKTAYIAGYVSLFNQLRASVPPGFLIGVNDGGHIRSDTLSFISGSMREGFPNQSGGEPIFGGTQQQKWEQNMVLNTNHQGGPYQGLFGNDRTVIAPPFNWINMLADSTSGIAEGGDPAFTAAANLRAGRYGGGTAALSEAYFSMTSNNNRIPGDDRWNVKFPHYAVDRTTGSASTNPLHKGWLGPPINNAYTIGVGIWRRDFKYGSVVVNTTGSTVAPSIEAGFSRIRSGIAGDTVDTGAVVSGTLSIPATDAVFLLRGTPVNVPSVHHHHRR